MFEMCFPLATLSLLALVAVPQIVWIKKKKAVLLKFSNSSHSCVCCDVPCVVREQRVVLGCWAGDRHRWREVAVFHCCVDYSVGCRAVQGPSLLVKPCRSLTQFLRFRHMQELWYESVPANKRPWARPVLWLCTLTKSAPIVCGGINVFFF